MRSANGLIHDVKLQFYVPKPKQMCIEIFLAFIFEFKSIWKNSTIILFSLQKRSFYYRSFYINFMVGFWYELQFQHNLSHFDLSRSVWIKRNSI